MEHELISPIPLSREGYYLREIVLEDAASYQHIYERLKERDQYYAFLWNYETINDDGSIDCARVGEQFVKRAITRKCTLPRMEYRFAICEESNVAGSVVVVFDSNYPNDPRLRGGGEIGFFISPEYQGLKLATLAISTIIQLAIKNGKMQFFWAMAHPANLSSLRVWQKLGMELIGETTSKEDLRQPERLLFLGKTFSRSI
jgi:RimJ/RimL family protein N-acetyltransferase